MPAPLAAALVLCALAADPAPPPPAPRLLARSSIAAVLARRGELGIGDAQVRQLEAREAALERKLAEIRKDFAGRPKGEPAMPEGQDDKGSASARTGGEGKRGGRHGNHGGTPAERALAAELQQRLDDADTAAWLAAEQLLPEHQREAARAVAERYREALADEREAERRR